MKVGFVGLGNMGNPMATNILKSGHELAIHDVQRERGYGLEAAGATWADTPKALAGQAEIVMVSLPHMQAVEEVALGHEGVFAGLAVGSTYVDTSTNAPSFMRHIAQIGERRGLHVLDAPISGGVFGAQDATLTVFVGGNQSCLESVRPVLESIGENIFYMGPSGSGNVVKLINNLMMFVNFLGACEGISMGAKAGIDLQRFLEVIAPSMGQSKMFERAISLFLSCGEIGSTTDLAVKDMTLGVELGRELGVPLEVGPLVRDMICRFREEGDRGSVEFTDMIQDFLLRSGVEVSNMQ